MKTTSYQQSYSSLQLKIIGKYACLLFTVILLGTITWLISFDEQLNIIYRFLLLGFSYTGILLLFISTKFRYLDVFVNNFVGKRGEDLISSILESELDSSYSYIKNYVVPDSKIGDIDGLLICPNELIIIEIKFYSGEYEIINGKFYKFHKKDRSNLCLFNPIKQAEKQKESLTQFLQQAGFNPHIRTLVVLANGRIRHIHGPTGIYVLNKDNLVDFIHKEISLDVISEPTKPIIDFLLKG